MKYKMIRKPSLPFGIKPAVEYPMGRRVVREYVVGSSRYRCTSLPGSKLRLHECWYGTVPVGRSRDAEGQAVMGFALTPGEPQA